MILKKSQDKLSFKIELKKESAPLEEIKEMPHDEPLAEPIQEQAPE